MSLLALSITVFDWLVFCVTLLPFAARISCIIIFFSASEMTYIVSSGALNSTHSLTIIVLFPIVFFSVVQKFFVGPVEVMSTCQCAVYLCVCVCNLQTADLSRGEEVWQGVQHKGGVCIWWWESLWTIQGMWRGSRNHCRNTGIFSFDCSALISSCFVSSALFYCDITFL